MLRIEKLKAEKEILELQNQVFEGELQKLKDEYLKVKIQQIAILEEQVKSLKNANVSMAQMDGSAVVALELKMLQLKDQLEKNPGFIVSEQIAALDKQIRRITLIPLEKLQPLEQAFAEYVKESSQELEEKSPHVEQKDLYQVVLMPRIDPKETFKNTTVIAQIEPRGIFHFDVNGNRKTILTEADPRCKEILAELDLGHYFTPDFRLREGIKSKSLSDWSLTPKKINNLVHLIEAKGGEVQRNSEKRKVPSHMLNFASSYNNYVVTNIIDEYKETGNLAKFFLYMKNVEIDLERAPQFSPDCNNVVKNLVNFATEEMKSYPFAAEDLLSEQEHIRKLDKNGEQGYPSILPFELDKNLKNLIDLLEAKRSYLYKKVSVCNHGGPSKKEDNNFDRNSEKVELLSSCRKYLEAYRIEDNAAKLFVYAESANLKKESLKRPKAEHLGLFQYDAAEVKTNALIEQVFAIAKAEIERKGVTPAEIDKERVEFQKQAESVNTRRMGSYF